MDGEKSIRQDRLFRTRWRHYLRNLETTEALQKALIQAEEETAKQIGEIRELLKLSVQTPVERRVKGKKLSHPSGPAQPSPRGRPVVFPRDLLSED